MSQSGMKDFDPVSIVFLCPLAPLTPYLTPPQESFTLQKYVEKLAQLDPRTGLGPLSKSRVEPFDAQVDHPIPCIPSHPSLACYSL